MTGIDEQIQKGVALAHKNIARLKGRRFVYTLVTDDTANPLGTEDITLFMQATPLVQLKNKVDGRIFDTLVAAGNLSAEALPVFILDRGSLKSSTGEFRDPTTFDSFKDVGGTQEFFVFQFTSIGSSAAGWFLTVTTKFVERARG